MAKLSEILKEGRAEQANKLDLSMLMEMVEQVYDAIGAKVIVEQETMGNDVLDTTTRETETVDIALPFVQLSEAWGKPGSLQRNDITKFVDRMGGQPGSSAAATLRNRIARLQKFATEALQGKGDALPISQVISNILLLDTLAAIVTSGEEAQYSASPAGFLFEAFLAALAGGDSSQIPAAQPGQEKTIADFTIKLPDEDGVPVSLKLLTSSGGEVKGSVSDLLNSFAGRVPEAAQLKRDWSGGRSSVTEAVDAEPEDQRSKPQRKMSPRSKWDPETGRWRAAKWDEDTREFVFDLTKDDPVSSIADNVVGMKYIVVLKTKGTSGVRLDFYEFDITWEKFKTWMEPVGKAKARIPAAASPKTQFKLTRGDYIGGTTNTGAGEIASFTLPSSNQVRLQAQEILKVLYNDFYEILKALKTTTDSLNTYLANPEDKGPGRTSALAADELEQDIIKTTGPTE